MWELVRPRKNIEWPFLTSNAPSGGSRGLAVRQAALFTYELLGGEKKKEGEVKRWFKPVNGLGDAGNSILYVACKARRCSRVANTFFKVGVGNSIRRRRVESITYTSVTNPRTSRGIYPTHMM